MNARAVAHLATTAPRAAYPNDAVLMQGLELLQELHRDPEADAAFAGWFDSMRNLFSLSGAELSSQSLSPNQVEALEGRDLYVTLNGMRPAKGRSHHELFTDQRAGNRRTGDLAALNAVWVDFDAYKQSLRPEDVYAAMVKERDRGGVPPWSIRIYSGRGLWVVWLLRDDADPDLPAKPTTENLDACSRINRALAERFKHMGADSNSTSLVRIARVPGSQNTKVPGPDGIVRWVIESPPPTYTVAALTTAFSAELTHRSPGTRPPGTRRGGPQGRRSASVNRGRHRVKRAPRGRAFTSNQAADLASRRWGLPLLDLFSLALHRRNRTKGHRHYFMFWMAHLLNRVLPKEHGKRSEIRRICLELNREWNNPLPEPDAERTMAEGMDWTPTAAVSHHGLTKIFDVSSEEGDLLRKLKPPRPNLKAARREALATVRNDWIDAKGSPPSVTELERELALAGHPVSRATVGRDLIALRCLTAQQARRLRPTLCPPRPTPPGD